MFYVTSMKHQFTSDNLSMAFDRAYNGTSPPRDRILSPTARLTFGRLRGCGHTQWREKQASAHSRPACFTSFTPSQSCSTDQSRPFLMMPSLSQIQVNVYKCFLTRRSNSGKIQHNACRVRQSSMLQSFHTLLLLKIASKFRARWKLTLSALPAINHFFFDQQTSKPRSTRYFKNIYLFCYRYNASPSLRRVATSSP